MGAGPLPLLSEGRRGASAAGLFRTYVFGIFASLVLVIAVLLPIDNFLFLGFTFETNYNEGWNVYNADRLIHGELFTTTITGGVNNYPIGSFLIVAGVNLLLHYLLLSGRLVSLGIFCCDRAVW